MSRAYSLKQAYPYIACFWLGAVASCSISDLDALSAGSKVSTEDASADTGGGAGGSSIADASMDGAGGASSTGGNGGLAGASGKGGSGGIVSNDGSATDGRAGASDAAGSAGTAGSGGAAGTGGEAGAAGSMAGGAAGTSGDAGTAGSGGAIDAGLDAASPTGAVFSVGSFVKSGTAGSQIVSHTLGQMPKALLLWTAGKTNESLSAGFYYGIGVSDGSSSIALAMSARDAATASWSSRRIASKILTLVQSGEITVAEADLSSMNASSITLNWTTNDNQPYVIHYLAIGGAAVSAKLVNWQAPTATGPKAVTGVGFQPEAVLHFHVGAAFVNAPPFSMTNGVIGMGAMQKGGAQWAVQVADATGLNPSVSTRAQRTDAAIFMYHAPSPTINKAASFVSMDAGGFTLNFTTASADASQVYSLALAGLQANVGAFTKSTAAAPATQAVATPFTPGAVFLSSYNIGPQTAPVRESQCSWGIGASDGTHAGSSALVAVDGVSPTAVEALDKTSKAFVKMNSPPMDAEADLASFDPSGFTLSWSTNDPVAAQMCFVALGAQ